MKNINLKINRIEKKKDAIIIDYTEYVSLLNSNDEYENYINVQSGFISDLINMAKTQHSNWYYIKLLYDKSKTNIEKYKFNKKLDEFDFFFNKNEVYYCFSKEYYGRNDFIFVSGNSSKEEIEGLGKIETLLENKDLLVMIIDSSKVELRNISEEMNRYIDKLYTHSIICS